MNLKFSGRIIGLFSINKKIFFFVNKKIFFFASIIGSRKHRTAPLAKPYIKVELWSIMAVTSLRIKPIFYSNHPRK